MMTGTRTWEEAYQEVKADLDRAVARNNELADEDEQLRARVAELEARPPMGLTRQQMSELRGLGYWRARANLLGSVVAAATGKGLPPNNAELPKFLGDHFIDSVKVAVMKLPPARDEVRGPAEDEGDEESAEELLAREPKT